MATKKNASSRPQPASSIDAACSDSKGLPGTVWRAVIEIQDATIGYLVTAADDVNRPIALVSDSEVSGGTTEALRIAWEIAETPDRALTRQCIDLRHRMPLPGGVHGLLCYPIDRQGKQTSNSPIRCEPAETPRKIDPAPMPPTPLSRKDALKLADVVELIVQGLRDNFPGNHHGRFRIMSLMPAGNLLGDHDEPVPDDVLLAVMGEFQAMPESEQLRALNGWSMEAISLGHAEWLKFISERPVCPCLSLTASPHPQRMNQPTYGEFGLMDSDHGKLHVQIRLGTTKHDAMAALDNLRESLDDEWDRLIVDPLDLERRRAARTGQP